MMSLGLRSCWMRSVITAAVGVMVGAIGWRQLERQYTFGPAFPSHVVTVSVANPGAVRAYASVLNTLHRHAEVTAIEPGATAQIRAAKAVLPQELARTGLVVTTFDDRGLVSLPVSLTGEDAGSLAFFRVLPGPQSDSGSKERAR